MEKGRIFSRSLNAGLCRLMGAKFKHRHCERLPVREAGRELHLTSLEDRLTGSEQWSQVRPLRAPAEGNRLIIGATAGH